MPDSPFDNLADKVFDACERAMGYDATWTPSVGGAEQSARVLFGEPTERETLGEYGDAFTPRTFFMEYWDGDFVGLFDASREGLDEYVNIVIRSVDRRFFVRITDAKYDGRNYRVRIEEVV